MTPDDRPLLQLLRSDVVLKLFRNSFTCETASTYTLQVSRLKQKSTTLEGLTAEEALTKLAEEMKADG